MGGGGGGRLLSPSYFWKKLELKRKGNIPEIKSKFVKCSGCLSFPHWIPPPRKSS
jgi:hypothetical protein